MNGKFIVRIGCCCEVFSVFRNVKKCHESFEIIVSLFDCRLNKFKYSKHLQPNKDLFLSDVCDYEASTEIFESAFLAVTTKRVISVLS